MTANETEIPPVGWTADAWTVKDAAQRLHVNHYVAEMFLESAVMRGEITRVSCGTSTAYLPGSTRIIQVSEDER